MHYLIMPQPMQGVLHTCFGHLDIRVSSRYFKKYSVVTQITYLPNVEVKVPHPECVKVGSQFLGGWVSDIRVAKVRDVWCWEISTTKQKEPA